MSQYASRAELAAMSLPGDALEEIDGGKQDEFLQSAAGKIDSYLRGRYKLPISGTLGPPSTYPRELRDANLAITAYEILGFRGAPADGLNPIWRERYVFYLGDPERGTRGWLDKLAAGAVSIDAALDATPDTHEGGGYVVDGAVRGFTDMDGNGVGEPVGNFWGGCKGD